MDKDISCNNNAVTNGHKSVRDPSTGRFQPGNRTGGRKPIPPELMMEIRAGCVDAVRLWVAYATDEAEKPEIRLRATENLMAYGYGKPVQAVEADVQADVASAMAVVRFEGPLADWAK